MLKKMDEYSSSGHCVLVLSPVFGLFKYSGQLKRHNPSVRECVTELSDTQADIYRIRIPIQSKGFFLFYWPGGIFIQAIR